MTTVSADNAWQRTWLVFRLGPYVMCASALDVEGIIQHPQRITKIPLTPDYVLGAFLFRDRSAAAISLRRKMKLGDGQDRATSPFVVARIGNAVVGFCVDEVKDVIQEKEAEWRPMPARLGSGLFDRFAIRANELILQTSFSTLREAQIEFAPLAAWVAAQSEPTQPAAIAPRADASAESAPLEDDEGGAKSPVVTETVAVPLAGEDLPEDEHGTYSVPLAATTTTDMRVRVLHAQAAIVAHRRMLSDEPRIDSGKETVTSILEPRLRRASPPASRHHSSWAAFGVAAGFAVSVAILVFAALQLRFTANTNTSATPISPASQDQAAGRVVSPPTPVAPAVEVAPMKDAPIVITVENPTDRAAAMATVSRGHTHVVVAGDTLWGIAKNQVGDPFRYPELAKLSRIANPDLIHPGDIVRIEIRAPRP